MLIINANNNYLILPALSLKRVILLKETRVFLFLKQQNKTTTNKQRKTKEKNEQANKKN